ncbi:tetratricopeptide repeat protein, partial [Candidatus Amarolinea dominans]|uniref:tetratricopeptide repeat protein n=1 Tax=Candidatus Amarolinea dominans TaxID=3140696 RepID=UPI0031373A1B|nr:tetratricopeptide repeat protein [Anaerolineae bacterium]
SSARHRRKETTPGNTGTKNRLSGRNGDLYSNQCKFDSAITYYKKTLAVMAQGNRAAPSAVDPGQRLPPNCDHSHAANLARQIGRVYGWQGQLEQALKWMKTGRNWLEGGSEAADQEVLALVDTHTASLRYQQGKLADAERLCRRALVLLGEDGNPAVRAEAWNMLGSVLDRRGKAQAALDAYRWSIGTWGALGNAFQVARVENNEAIIIAYQGELTRALTIYERILRYFREQVHDPYRAAVAMTNIGRIHAITGNYDTALEHHQHALKSAHELDIPWLQATALVNLTWALLNTGPTWGAEPTHRQ